MIIGFLIGVSFVLFLLVFLTMWRRKRIKRLVDELTNGAQNSKEHVGESVLAVIIGDKTKRIGS